MAGARVQSVSRPKPSGDSKPSQAQGDTKRGSTLAANADKKRGSAMAGNADSQQSTPRSDGEIEVGDGTSKPTNGVIEKTASKKPTGGIVQFSTAIYFAKENEDKEMSIDVMRLGCDKEAVQFSYQTKDSSAKAGDRYVKVSGELEIPAGESMVQIKVPIISNPAWAGTLEFEVHLSKPENCTLGKYLWKCRVKVIDSNAFPTDMFRDEVLNGTYTTDVPW
eukprot:gnl/MRDRNA2_/MRDRNA2_180844_c0_seq1.p1 gnl/MRDRNA2_/MRDRNA2_180844_c0~~gnl/MRDRNA2_/MRDRNA2_180844_c0_seq1.p1  ORF type:complete len:229 (+),score=45.81 gnl/MRDRNA2_/MRDRNA2_180844_c0_seq1:26-688(+)